MSIRGIGFVVLLPVCLVAAAAERDSVTERYKWNLADLYPTEQAWSAEKRAIERDIPDLAALRGTLDRSPEALWRALEAWADLDLRTSRLASYASMLNDLDQRVGRSRQMDQQATHLRTDLAAAAAWVRPEILALGPDKVRAWIDAEPRLAPWRQPLEDVLRRGPHTLPPDSEKIVAQAGNLALAGRSIREVFANADFPYPTVTLSSGEQVTLDAAAYSKHRAATNREDRRRVFEAFWNRHGEYMRTFGTALNAHVETHVFEKRVRNFHSCLEAALFADNIPVAVYSRLIDAVRANLPTLHRYLRLRQRLMGLDRLGYEDLYAPVLPAYERTFTPEEAIALTLDAVTALGDEYRELLRRGLDGRWVDWFPSPGKRSGAYSTTLYGTHPFQLQNFTGLYDEVSTLAHEAGHSMHSLLSNRTQPYATHDYPTFVAEVASTLNENLLFHSMVARAPSEDERLILLGSYLDGMRTTLFRQTLFAEFELRIHEQVERGEPLTGESLNALYLGLLRDYYGHAEGVCRIADAYGAEWAYVPHFYYDFYVYQYATSLVASTSLAEGIRAEAAATPPSTARRDGYLGLLAAGSSRYAFDLLKDAGVDLARPEPYAAAFREMDRVIDEIESILDRRGKQAR